MVKLNIKFQHSDNPYHDNENVELEAWGKIQISIISGDDKHELLDWQWNVLTIAEWYIDNKKKLFNSTLPGVHENESLADALSRLRNVAFEDHEDNKEYAWHSTLHNYWNDHSLRSAMRGANIPDIIIGMNNLKGEISLSEDAVSWAYQFDSDVFKMQIESQLVEFIKEWREMALSTKANDYGELLLGNIRK